MIHIDNKSFPPDIRIEKEANALAKAGFRVTVLAVKQDGGERDHEQIKDNFWVRRYKIREIPVWSKLPSKFTLSYGFIDGIVESFMTAEKPDVLHVHDFKYVPSVVMAARKHRIPVVADLHENMPAALRSYRSGLPPAEKLKRYILDNDSLWRHHERRYLPQCERIIVVVPEAAERLRAYGIPDSRVKIVSNTEDESTFGFDPARCDRDITEKYASQWMVSYIGGIGPHRGIDTALKGVPRLQSAIENFKLVIVGATPRQKRVLEKTAASMGVEGSIEVLGWQPFDMVNSYVCASRVCLVPHNDFEHTQTTVPHKLFQYMICGRPVLVSNCRPLERIVTEADAGYIFRANDAVDFAERLIHIHGNPDQARAKGQNGQQAALGKYAWRHDAARLVEMYAELFNLKEELVRN